MDNNRSPLWLPKGSVRAILALGITASVLTYAFLTREFPEQLIAVMGIVIAFYFGVKSGSEKPES